MMCKIVVRMSGRNVERDECGKGESYLLYAVSSIALIIVAIIIVDFVLNPHNIEILDA